MDTKAKSSHYRQGLTVIEQASSNAAGDVVLGLYIYSASVALKRSESSRLEYRKIRPHLIGTPAIVASMPGISQSELARLLGCERATAGLQVAECVKLGWIKRLPSGKDKRRYELHLTASGDRMLTQVRKVIARQESDFLAPLSQEERETLRRILLQLIS